MTDFVETYIKKIRKKNIFKNILLFFKDFLYRSEKYTNKGKIRIEIEKNKLEKKRKLLKLGNFISQMYKDEKVVDFSYKEDFFKYNNEIKKIDDYLDRLDKDKDSI